MQSASTVFWKGFWLAAPFCVVVVPFGMAFGILATEAGFTVFQTISFSFAVLAGAAQFTALTLMQDQAPTVIVIVTALAVNLRMALYSASLGQHLIDAPFWTRALIAYSILDPSYALSDAEYRRAPDQPLRDKVVFFFGTTTLSTLAWLGGTAVGATLGTKIPASWELDFAIPIAFIAVLAPALRTLPMVVAAFSSTILALVFAPIPFGLGLLLAAMCAMVIGADVWPPRHDGINRNNLDRHRRRRHRQFCPAVRIFGVVWTDQTQRLGPATFTLYSGRNFTRVGCTAVIFA